MGTGSVGGPIISSVPEGNLELIKRTTLTSRFFRVLETSLHKATASTTLGSSRGRKISLWVAQPLWHSPTWIYNDHALKGSVICQARLQDE